MNPGNQDAPVEEKPCKGKRKKEMKSGVRQRKVEQNKT